MNARKPQPRNAAKGTWQGRWDRVDITGQWTKRLMGDVRT